MAVHPPAPAHFSNAPPPPAPRSRKNVIAGVVAVLITAAALADAFHANRRAAHAIERADRAEARERASDAARRAELERAAAQVSGLRARMKRLEAKARGVGTAWKPPAPSDAGAAR